GRGGLTRRFSPLLRELKQFVGDGSERIVANYRVSAGAIPLDHWTQDIAQGGGRALGEGCHFVDSLAFVVGAPVERVFATGYGAAGTAVQARDNLVIALSFADGSVGSILYVADGSSRVGKERLEVFSGSKTAVLDDYLRLELFGPQGRQKREGGTMDKGHDAELHAFVDGVTHGELPVPLDEIGNVSLATLAIVESLRTGQPVGIDTRL